jgi:hypothetical protein
MATPTIEYDPSNPEWRRQVIAGSSDEQLKALFNDVQATMHSLIFKEPRPPRTPVSGDYSIWETFLKEIEAEEQKRWTFKLDSAKVARNP